jgi:hypothetical protein
MGEEINRMIERIIPQMQQFWVLIVAIITLTGLAILIIGLIQIVKNANRSGANQGNRFGSGSILLLIGFILINTYAALDSLSMSVFHETSMNSLSYLPPESLGQKYIQLAVYIIQMVGLCGFVKGWLIINKSYAWGITHIIGGFLAVNLVATLKSLGLSLGGPIQDAIQFTLG